MGGTVLVDARREVAGLGLAYGQERRHGTGP